MEFLDNLPTNKYEEREKTGIFNLQIVLCNKEEGEKKKNAWMASSSQAISFSLVPDPDP